MVVRSIALALSVLVLVLGLAPAVAQEPSAEEKAFIAKMEALRDGLKPQHGTVALPEAKASLALGEGYYFLGQADAKKVLTEGWGNPPEAAEGVLGMVFASGTDFTMADAWGGVITFEKTGYVSDEDAAKEDYDTVLSQMQDGENERNEILIKEGFPSSHLRGWAQPPTYDATRHDLIWAREIQFGAETDNTLNYDVRHLGRNGVLSINMVSHMSQLATVRSAAANLAKTAEFTAGARYADYKAGDAKAGYGLAGLVAAGAGVAVAKKAGFLAVLVLLLKKGGVIFLGVAAAIGGWLRKVFNKKPPAPPTGGGDIVE